MKYFKTFIHTLTWRTFLKNDFSERHHEYRGIFFPRYILISWTTSFARTIQPEIQVSCSWYTRSSYSDTNHQKFWIKKSHSTLTQDRFCHNTEIVLITGKQTAQPLDGCQSPSFTICKSKISLRPAKADKPRPAFGTLYWASFPFQLISP